MATKGISGRQAVSVVREQTSPAKLSEQAASNAQPQGSCDGVDGAIGSPLVDLSGGDLSAFNPWDAGPVETRQLIENLKSEIEDRQATMGALTKEIVDIKQGITVAAEEKATLVQAKRAELSLRSRLSDLFNPTRREERMGRVGELDEQIRSCDQKIALFEDRKEELQEKRQVEWEAHHPLVYAKKPLELAADAMERGLTESQFTEELAQKNAEKNEARRPRHTRSRDADDQWFSHGFYIPVDFNND